MFAGDLGHLFDADLGDDGFGWVEVLFAHIAIFAIFASFCQAKFANCAISKFAKVAIILLMSDPQHEIRVWMKECLEFMGHGSKSRLASALNVKPDAVTRMMNTEADGKEVRTIKAHELGIMARFFGKDPPGGDPTEVPFVKIRGKAGAGPDGSVLFATGDGYFGEVPAPEGATENTSALEVEGDSMRGLANDGWLIFYEEKEDPRPDHMGEPCVCFLEDDRVLVKTPYPGSQRGLYHLESVNAPMMLDVPVRYFAFVTDIKPRRSAQKHIRRNPNAEIQDVRLDGRRP